MMCFDWFEPSHLATARASEEWSSGQVEKSPVRPTVRIIFV